MLPDLLFYPVYSLVGYTFLSLKYRDEKKKKEILFKQYDNSYASAGKILFGQVAVGILITLVGGALLLFLLKMTYDLF